MPYNIDPIAPTEEMNGTTALPLARVKRIIKLDEEIGACNSGTAFLVTVAAEMFIQYLAQQGYKGSQKDRRKNLQYKDLANAVAALDTLEFLSDTIPRTVPYKKIATERIRKVPSGPGAGQMTIHDSRLQRGGPDYDDDEGRGGVDLEEEEEEEADEVLGEMKAEMRGESMDIETIRMGHHGNGNGNGLENGLVGYGFENSNGSGKRKLSEEEEDEDEDEDEEDAVMS